MTTANLTIADNDTVVQYTSTGETSFEIPFPFLADAEIAVSVDQVDQVLGVDFTLTGAGEASGGMVTFAAATTAGEVITIWLDMPIKRLTGFSTGAATLLGEDLNTEFVRQVRQDQMLRRDIRRALRLAVDDPQSGQDMELPSQTARAGKFLAFTAGGAPTVASVTGSEDTTLRTDLASTDSAKGNELVAYVQSNAEQAAGVTIVNPHLPPGYVKRYGNNTTPGTTDMTSALNDALSQGFALFDDDEVYAVSQIALTSDAVLIGLNGHKPTIQCNNGGAVQEGFITVTGSYSAWLSSVRLDGNEKVDRLLYLVNGDDAGVGESVVALDCDFVNTESNTRASSGMRIDGGVEKVIAQRCLYRNINANGTSKVASGIQVDSESGFYARHVGVDSCEFDDITPVADADGINASALTGTMNESHLSVTNCKFRDCHKRAVKSQMYSSYVAGNQIERTADHSSTNSPEIAIQAGGGVVRGNKFFYADGDYCPGLIVQVNNVLNGSTPTSHLNPSIVDGNLVYIGNSTALDHFVQVNCALASTGNDLCQVINNRVHGNVTKFAYLIPNDGDTAHIQIDELLLANNYVEGLSGTNAAFIWGARLDGSEDPDLGTNVEIRARVRDNYVGTAASAGYYNGQAGNAFTTGSGVDFTILEWLRNTNLSVPEVSSGVPANVTILGNTDTTPSVLDETFVEGGSGAITITDFDDGKPGQQLIYKANAGVTFDVTGTNLNAGTTDITVAAGDILHWICADGTNWYLIGFMDASVDNSGGA